MNGGLSMPSITTSSWLSASWPPPPMPPNIAAGELVDDPVDDRVRPACRRALLEQPVAPAPRLDDQVAGRVLRAPRAVEREVADVAPRVRVAGRRHLLLQRLAAHADGVDLVDEDDALAAPLARELLGPPREHAHDDRVDADEGRGEARAGHRDERRVEAGRERLGEHRLARARRAEEEQAALALAARTLERLARLPDRDDAPHLFLRLRLPADVVQLDAPFRVARLERPHLRRGSSSASGPSGSRSSRRRGRRRRRPGSRAPAC